MRSELDNLSGFLGIDLIDAEKESADSANRKVIFTIWQKYGIDVIPTGGGE